MANGLNNGNGRLRWSETLTRAVAILAIIASVAGWAANRASSIAGDALIEDQIMRNTRELEAHDLDVFEYKLDEIKADIQEIKELLKD